MTTYTTQIINKGTASEFSMTMHVAGDCAGEFCPVHKPSEHSMRDLPLHFRWDRALFERICTHSVGHPDPDSLQFLKSLGRKGDGIHGCCAEGCCARISTS